MKPSGMALGQTGNRLDDSSQTIYKLKFLGHESGPWSRRRKNVV